MQGVVPDPNTATTYFQFQVDTSNYGGAQISFDTELTPNGYWAAKNDMYVFASPDGTNWTQIYSIISMTKSLLSHGPIAVADSGSNDITGVSSTWIRIINVGQKTAGNYGTVQLSSIYIDGCPRPVYPTLSKSFADVSICKDGYSSLTFSITNPNSHGSLTGVAFTDTLPSGLVVATPNGLTGGCGSGTITATAGSGTIGLSGATLTAGSSCTFSVDVTGSTAGLKTNSVTVTSTNGCTGNTATADVIVRAVIPSIGFVKQVSYSATGPWFKYVEVETGSTVYYRFTVENTGETTLTGISVTDPLLCPSGCSCSWSASIPVAVARNDDHIEYCVPTETITALAGYHPNTATILCRS